MTAVPGPSPAPPHRLVEFLNAISRCDGVASATRTASELVAEEFDAEVGAVVLRGQLVTCTGFGQDEVPVMALEAIGAGMGPAALGVLGECDTLASPWSAGTSGRLVVARVERPFDLEERHLLMGMAAALGLVIDMLAVIDRERRRQRVLQVLLDIQRAISHREPLPTVLQAVTAGASTVLGGCDVSLVLTDAVEPERPIVVGAHLDPALVATRVPVHVHGTPVGLLLAAAPDGGLLDADDEALLTAFAENASLALADARTLEVMAEAFRDPLTGTPNRRLFLDRLTQALLRDRTAPGGPAVLFIDLDRFKAVNDSLGHSAGDELLRQVAGRIRAQTREGSAARIGGDEFTVLLEHVERPDDALAVANRIIADLGAAFTIDGKVVHIGATIGVALVDEKHSPVDAEELVRNADVAMYRAKATGGGRAIIYDPRMGAALVERLELQTDLQSALANDELMLHFQPIVDLTTGTIRGAEALMRWRNPKIGMVGPTDFIPLAEVTGAIVPIGRWALQTACARLAVWRRSDPALTVNVNVSVHQLRDPGLVDDVRHVLVDAGLPGEALVLEITEGVLLEDEEQMLAQLRALRQLGLRIALDDFGTGYSSLGYLRHYPVDSLKIDRSFVSGSASGSGGEQLVRTIIELGRSYGLSVTAEGVETEEQRSRLVALGCRSGQGWLFARALPAEEFATLLTTSLDRV